MRIEHILTSVIVLIGFKGLSQFAELSQSLDIIHQHISPTLIGGGVAAIDVNNDGWEDLYLTAGRGADQLLLSNNGESFSDESNTYIPPYIRSGSQTTGVSVGDVNNDGWDDLFITTIDDDEPNYLLLNREGEFFLDVTNAAGLIGTYNSSGSVLLDWNNDGLLDIYILNYVEEVNFIRDTNNLIVGFDHICEPNLLYLNNGDLSFSLVGNSPVNGKGCALAGLNTAHDSSKGLYIANDYGEWVHPNEFFVENEVTGGIEDLSAQIGLNIGLYGMGIAISDVNRDESFDYYITNIGSNALMIESNGFYMNEAIQKGVDNTWIITDSLLSTGWGTNFFDYDNDGWEDLFVANGYIPSSRFIPTYFLDSNKLYKNKEGEFIDISESVEMDFLGNSRGSVTLDFDRDGDLDLFVSTIVSADPDDDVLQQSKFYRNDFLGGSFVQLKLEGVRSNRNAYGAIVKVYNDSTVLTKLLHSSGTHASQSEKLIHFGLGEEMSVDSIVVFWPSGINQTILSPPVNQLLHILENIEGFEILGCKNESADNFNPRATVNYACSAIRTSTTNVSDDSILIFPNPAKNEIFVQTDFNAEFSILDSKGRITKGGPINENGLINISELTSGIYYLIIEEGERINYRKIVVIDE